MFVSWRNVFGVRPTHRRVEWVRTKQHNKIMQGDTIHTAVTLV